MTIGVEDTLKRLEDVAFESRNLDGETEALGVAINEIKNLTVECNKRKTLIRSLLKDIGEMKDESVAYKAVYEAGLAWRASGFAVNYGDKLCEAIATAKPEQGRE